MKTAIFPGSFDPITIGHTDIINRALPLFDKIIIAIGHNTTKKYLFPLEQRKEWLEKLFINNNKIEVASYEGLTIDFCKANNVNYILRGFRNAIDFEYEKAIAQMNNSMSLEIETICLFCKPEHAHISSTIVREIIINKGDVRQFLPKGLKLD